MVRYVFIFVILFQQVFSLCAQDGSINISVAMPSDCILDNNTKSILKNKLLKIVTSQGVAGVECGAIIIVPEVDVVNSSVVSGGMRNITSVELGITLTVRNMITNTVFNTIQIYVKGEGYSNADAKRSAVNGINVSSPEYAGFMANAKSKIIDYYSRNMSSLIAKAKTLASQQLYDEALALLTTYPESLPGYVKVSESIISIFKECQSKYCEQILLSAQAAYSQRNYKEAAELVAMIDAGSSCASQAKSLLNSIKAATDKQHDDMIALEKENIRSEERIKTAQINAVKDIATAYFQRQTEYIFLW